EAGPLAGGEGTVVLAAAAAYAGMTLLDREAFVPGPGVIVGSADAGLPADRAGVLEGDVIVAFGGAPVPDRVSLVRRIGETRPGAPVPLSVLRGGRELRLRIELEDRPVTAEAPLRARWAWMRTPDEAVVPSRFGLRVVTLSTGASHALWRAPGALGVVDAAG